MLGPEQAKKLMYASDNASHEAEDVESVHITHLGKEVNIHAMKKLLMEQDSSCDEIMSAMPK